MDAPTRLSYRCLGGTPEDPHEWWRISRSGRRPDERVEGRICKRKEPYTAPSACSSCPAYRGRRYDTSIATGLYPDGEPYALSSSEYAAWQRAMDLALEHDDFSGIARFEVRMEAGIGDQTLRRIGDPDALDRRAAYMRGYRKGRSRTDEDRARDAERARRYRKRHVTAPRAREASQECYRER